jgi:hypothetical protein
LSLITNDIHVTMYPLYYSSEFYVVLRFRVMVMVFNATVSNISATLYIVVASVIGGGYRSTWRKPQTCRKSLTNFII